MTLMASSSAISSPESEDGRSLSPSQVGRQADLFGPGHARVPPSPPQARSSDARSAMQAVLSHALDELASSYVGIAAIHGLPTGGTFSRSSGGSSPSAALQRSLANRLQAAMAGHGSPEYVVRWKSWDTLLGPPICALRARARKPKDGLCVEVRNGGNQSPLERLKSDNGFTGWPTATVNDATGSQYAYSGGDHSKKVLKLPGAVHLAGWPTPCAMEPNTHPDVVWARKQRLTKQTGVYRGNDCGLGSKVHLAGWPTPTTQDHKDGASVGTAPDNALLGRVAWQSNAPMARSGASLNPYFSAWLMGFPPEWIDCRPAKATRSRKASKDV